MEAMNKTTFETFRELGPYELSKLEQDAPSCFNGIVRVEKFCVTVEKVDEPVEVIRARLQKLWDECENIHNYDPLIRTGLKYGIDLRKRETSYEQRRSTDGCRRKNLPTS